jgi:acetyltransferase-like isoleucine patch superfamily enzyme
LEAIVEKAFLRWILKSYIKIIITYWQRLLQVVFFPGLKIHSHISFFHHVIAQKVLNLNGSRRVNWPVHFTSQVTNPQNIEVGAYTAPGRAAGQYVQAINKITFGENIYMAPGVKIISANHENSPPIILGDNCWLGANSVILPGVTLGPSTVVGAGAVVSKSFPAGHVVIVGVPARALKRLSE